MKKKIINIKEDYLVNELDGLTIPELIEYFTDKLESHGPECKLDYEIGENGGIEFRLITEREETDEEHETRLASERSELEEKRKKELRTAELELEAVRAIVTKLKGA